MVDALPRRAGLAELETIALAFSELHGKVDKLLNNHVKTQIMDANDTQNERQQSNSNTDSIIEFEPALEKAKGRKTEPVKLGH